MDYLKNYDETSPTSIEQYAQQLIGLSFEDVIQKIPLLKKILQYTVQLTKIRKEKAVLES